MFAVLFTIAFLCIVYFSEVVALMWQCERIPELNKAKKYVWAIPFLSFIFFFTYLHDGDEGVLKNARTYISVPCKNLVLLKIYVSVVEEIKNSRVPVKAKYRNWNKEQAYRNRARKQYTDEIAALSEA